MPPSQRPGPQEASSHDNTHKQSKVDTRAQSVTGDRHPLGTLQVTQGLRSMSRIMQNLPQHQQTPRMYMIVRNNGRLFFDVASMQGTQTMFSGRNRALMRGCSTTPSATEVFPIPPAPSIQTRDVSSFKSNWVISSIMTSRPWKTAGFRGIC